MYEPLDLGGDDDTPDSVSEQARNLQERVEKLCENIPLWRWKKDAQKLEVGDGGYARVYQIQHPKQEGKGGLFISFIYLLTHIRRTNNK